MSTNLPIQMLDLPRSPKRLNTVGMSRSAATLERGFKRRLISLPLDLWKKLDQLADASWRNTTQEVRRRLEDSVANESVDEHAVIVQHIPTVRK